MLAVIVCIAFIIIFNTKSVVSASIVSTSIYAVDDSTIIYDGINSGRFMYEEASIGFLDVGYQGNYGAELEIQALLKSFKVTTSTNHNWSGGSANSSNLPAATAGSTQSRVLASDVPVLKPTLALFDITDYVSAESMKSNSNKSHINSGQSPYLIIAYSEIVDITITGVTDGGAYNTNVTPQFNVGTATLNGNAFTSGTAVTAEGSYTLVVTSGSQQETVQFRIDKTFPTAYVILNNGSLFANSQYASVSIIPDPGVNDIVSMRYSVNGGSKSPNQPYYSEFSIDVGEANGAKSITIELIDAAGNVSPLYYWYFTMNTTIPTGTFSINSGAAYTTTQEVDLTIAVNASSNEVVSMRFSTDNSNWSSPEAYSWSKRYTLPSGDGNKTVYIQLIDRYGNIGVMQRSILLDMTPPRASVLINNGDAYTNNTNVAVAITPDPGMTDIASIRYSLNGSAATTIAYTSSFQINVGNTDGAKAITIRLIDGAGNESPLYSSDVTLDTEVPIGTVAINEGAAYTTDHNVALDFTLGADVTDVVSVQFSNDNTTWSSERAYSSSMSYTLPAGDGSKTIYVKLIDRAGNVGLAQDSIILDMTAPIVEGVKDGESYSSSRIITFNEGSATLNGNSFLSGSPVDAEDSYELIVTDAAGNSITITFSIVKYRVSYDGNGAIGGLVPIDSQIYETGNSVTVANNTGSLVKTGFTFKGWNTEADGSGRSYAANDTFYISTANVILYAAWDISQYTLSFESNGGSVVATQNKIHNEMATEPSAPTKSGYTFGGWYKEITLTNQWSFTKDLITANTTLYAKWIGNGGGNIPTPTQNSTVYFETNGGNVIDNLAVVNGSKLTELPTPTKEGFVFVGWYHDAALTQKWDITTDQVTKNIKLYAQWIVNTTSTPKPAVSFNDTSGHWAQGMIEELSSQGMITGYPDGSFHPNDSIQRQHMALIFMRAFKLEPAREGVSFSDVSPNNPYYEAITLLQQAGIVDGTNGRFNPSEPVTRAQMAKIVALALKAELGGTSTFQDVPSTHWGYAYITALADLEIVLGDNGKFNPNEPVTRAQFVAMIYRALNLTK